MLTRTRSHPSPAYHWIITVHNRVGNFILAAIAGAIGVVALTLIIYGSFFQDFLTQFTELSPQTVELITRDSVKLVPFVVANLAHGALLATVITWGKFHTPLRGAAAAATVAFLTEVYFLFTQHAIFKTMDLVSAVADTAMWTLVNAIVGALVAWILARGATGRSKISPATTIEV